MLGVRSAAKPPPEAEPLLKGPPSLAALRARAGLAGTARPAAPAASQAPAAAAAAAVDSPMSISPSPPRTRGPRTTPATSQACTCSSSSQVMAEACDTFHTLHHCACRSSWCYSCGLSYVHIAKSPTDMRSQNHARHLPGMHMLQQHSGCGLGMPLTHSSHYTIAPAIAADAAAVDSPMSISPSPPRTRGHRINARHLPGMHMTWLWLAHACDTQETTQRCTSYSSSSCGLPVSILPSPPQTRGSRTTSANSQACPSSVV